MEPLSPRSAPLAGGNGNQFGATSGSGAVAAGNADAAVGAPAPSAGPGDSPVVPGAAPRVVKNAVLHLSVAEKAVERIADRVPGVAAAAGGFVTASERTGAEADLRAHYTLRVPAARFDATRAELGKLGKLRDETIDGRDVTGQLVDYEARLRSMRAEEESLRAILSKANTVGETLQVTQALAGVRGRIEQLDAERARLADAADLSTIDVTIASSAAAFTEPKPDPLLARSVERAAGAALGIIGGTIVVLGALVPVVAMVAIVWLAYRAIARRRRPVGTAVAS